MRTDDKVFLVVFLALLVGVMTWHASKTDKMMEEYVLCNALNGSYEATQSCFRGE